MCNISDAIRWVSQNETVCLKKQMFIKESSSEKIYRCLFSNYDRQKVQKIIDFIILKLATKPENEKTEYFQLSHALVKRYGQSRNLHKIVQTFDRQIVRFKNEVQFSHPLNQAAYQKWMRYDMPSLIYQKHPEFCQFLETSGLLSQIKVTKYPPKEIDGRAALLVNGVYRTWPEIKTMFEVVYSKRYKERFLVHKETREVYTFLDNGKGLQPHHPFLNELNPISQLTTEEYDRVLKKAHSFVRPNEKHLSEKERQQRNQNRIFILQAVTSFLPGPESNAHRFLIRAKHPYLRLIVGANHKQANVVKGEVYEVGFFGWISKGAIPLIATQGQFRSPDIYEYVNCDEKIVTNIPITQEEARSLYYYTIKYHRDGVNIGNQPAFHIGEQNCSTYARMAIAAVGVAVPTEISLGELLQEIAPNWIRTIGRMIASVHHNIEGCLKCVVKVILPRKLQYPLDIISAKISKLVGSLFKSIAALSLLPLRTALSSGLSGGGEAFVPLGSPDRRIEPALRNWKSWLNLSSYRTNLPAVFQQWQRQQASTVIYHRPVKLAIVPE